MCVLLVEDEDFIRHAMADELVEEGFEVAQASTGDDAIELMGEPPCLFSILVTDLNMPGKSDGAAVAEEARLRWPDLPVVIASGRLEIFKGTWMADMGYRALPKPYRPIDLVRLIRELVPLPG